MLSKTSLTIVFLVILLAGSLFATSQGFTSPGTMVQLASSHVPTAEDYNYYKNIYPKVVRRDLIDMTGGDPGPLNMPMPQLWMD